MLEPGQLVDAKYKIVRLLGVGGMGSVYEAENLRIQRRVAIKVLNVQLTRGSEEFVERFEREAQAAARIGSPHIVDVLDLGNLPSGDRYLVMEYLAGETLGAFLADRGGAAPLDELVPILLQVLDALGAAHAAGIVHRDVKPDNVFLINTGGRRFVKLVDFGASKFVASEGVAPRTLPGAVLGTPAYMAPEQARGATTEVDLRSDLYSVGVLLYEGLSGQGPFSGANVNEILFKVALSPAPPLLHANPALPHELVAIVERAMWKTPDGRFQTATALREALATWLLAWAAREGSPSYCAELARSIEPVGGPRAFTGGSDSALAMGRSPSHGASRGPNRPQGSSPSMPSAARRSVPEMFEATMAAGPSVTTGNRPQTPAPSATRLSSAVSVSRPNVRAGWWLGAALGGLVIMAAALFVWRRVAVAPLRETPVAVAAAASVAIAAVPAAAVASVLAPAAPPMDIPAASPVGSAPALALVPPTRPTRVDAPALGPVAPRPKPMPSSATDAPTPRPGRKFRKELE